MTKLEIDNRFSYHKPIGNQPERYEVLRGKAKELAWHINDLCPESREKSLAITELESAIMWANASIARNEGEDNSTRSIACCERDHDRDGNCARHPASRQEAVSAAKVEGESAHDLASTVHAGLIDLHVFIGNLPRPRNLSGIAAHTLSRKLVEAAVKLRDMVSAGAAPTESDARERMSKAVAALMSMGINLNPGQIGLLWNSLK